MLSALDEKGQLICLLDKISDKEAFSCPACGRPVRLKKGPIIRPHFAHINLKDCKFYHENESMEHLSLKSELYRSLVRFAPVQVEKVLTDIKQVADLLVGENLAIEVQCSRLSERRLRERSQSYRNKDLYALWLLGKKLWLKGSLTNLQKQFLYFSENMGFHLWELDLEKRLIRLKYLIYEDWKGQATYLSRSCSFDGPVLDFFRLPYKEQRLTSYEVESDKQLMTYIRKQLYYQDRRWLRLQEDAYKVGDNLLTKQLDDYFPQIKPIESANGFCQIEQDLLPFREAFFHFYAQQKDKSRQTLYPPAYYHSQGIRRSRGGTTLL